jgi:arylamine N-acetyltransferase
MHVSLWHTDNSYLLLCCFAFNVTDHINISSTPEHHMAVTPEDMYQRMVVANRGSYCFGQNGLFLHMLRGLGYR